MTDLERRALLGEKLFLQRPAWTGQSPAAMTALRMLRPGHTIDPESLRPRGHWEKETVDGPDVVKYTSLLSVFCSRCRRRAWMKSTYCPHCGAKMEDAMNG